MNNGERVIRLEERFVLLHEIITLYRSRLHAMEQEVIQLFTSDQLSEISARMAEKQRITRLVRQLEQFVKRWEDVESTGIEDERLPRQSGLTPSDNLD